MPLRVYTSLTPATSLHSGQAPLPGGEGFKQTKRPFLLSRFSQYWEKGQGIRVAPFLLMLVYLVVVIRTAWMSDDAYLTLRTVDNFVHGYGPVWNVGERVQAYTHPLWMLALAAFYFITHEPYFTTLLLSIIIDVVAVWLFCRKVAQSNRAAALGMVLLIFTRSFIDYSTSGLENPLTYLLLVLFFWIYLSGDPKRTKQLFLLAFLAGLTGLNRLDLLPLLLPALLVGFWRRSESQRRDPGRKPGWAGWLSYFTRVVAPFTAGFLPLIIWFAFSLIYYGFFLPNTAYAKLNVNIPAGALIHQGFLYGIDSFLTEPLTLVTIGGSFMAVIAGKKRRLIPILIGMFSYLLYILRIGGDFMSGRLFTPVFLCAVIVLSQVKWPFRRDSIYGYLFIALLVIQFISPYSTLLSGRNYRVNEDPGSLIGKWGIADERGFYYRFTGLLRVRLDSASPHLNNWVVEPGKEIQQKGIRVAVIDMAGMRGYYAGPQPHLIDQMALADAFLARLPYTPQGVWRIGHFRRALPCGYYETFVTGTNQLVDPGLAAYLDKLDLVIRGPLFTRQRWQEIWNFNTGKYGDLLKGYDPTINCSPVPSK